MTKEITSKVIVGVVSAIVLAALVLIWNAITSGGLVRAMGGVTQDQLGSAGFIPSGAVLAFDLSPQTPAACPDGWQSHRELRGRIIVGAGFHSNGDENGGDLSTHTIGDTGGAETHVLDVNQLPKHGHVLQAIVGKRPLPPDTADNFIIARNWLGDGAKPLPHERPAITQTWAEGGGKAHNNMPPYLALLYCIKE